MSRWTNEELAALSVAGELMIGTRGSDGVLRPLVPIWLVRVDDDIYVRSYKGRDSQWFRRALKDPHGRIQVPGIDRSVTLVRVDDNEEVQPAVSDAYRGKYGHFSDAYIQPMIAPAAVEATLRVLPL